MTDGWIDVDGAALEDLPAWTRVERPNAAVVLSDQGIACIAGKTGSTATWPDVLGVAVISSDRWMPHAFVLVPRRPPAPPWFAITEGMLPAELREGGLERFAAIVRQRAAGWSYREASAGRPRMPLAELQRRVFARQEIQGAVEIPVGPPPGRTLIGPGGAIAATLAGATAIGYLVSVFGLPFVGVALGLAPEAALAVGATALGACSFLGGGLGFGAALPKRTKSNKRVLVLAPDGCVAGFYDGVHAIAWPEVARFEIGTLAGSECLAVVGKEAGRVGRVEAHWFSQPLELIVAVAEAYRKRATAAF